jgi:hypothetical protein
MRTKSRSYPVKYYDVIKGKMQNKPAEDLRNEILSQV